MLRTQLEMWGHMTSLDKLNSPLVVSAWGELLALKKLVAPRLARSKPIRMTRKTLKMKVLPPPLPPPLCGLSDGGVEEDEVDAQMTDVCVHPSSSGIRPMVIDDDNPMEVSVDDCVI